MSGDRVECLDRRMKEIPKEGDRVIVDSKHGVVLFVRTIRTVTGSGRPFTEILIHVALDNPQPAPKE